jgi:hypothetical protein
MRVYTNKKERRGIQKCIEKLSDAQVISDWGYYDNNYSRCSWSDMERIFMEASCNNGFFEKKGVDVYYT